MGSFGRAARWLCVTAVLAAPAAAQRQWMTFDGGVEAGGGLGFSFSRPSAAYLWDGQTVGPDEMRFGRETLLCGLAPQTLLQLGRSISPVAAGQTDDGTPVFVIDSATQQRVSVHLGQGQVDAAFARNDWSHSHKLLYDNPAKDYENDLLMGQTGVNGGSVDQPGLAFGPTDGGAVHNGLIVMGCEVTEPHMGVWVSSRVGLVYTTVDRLGSQDPWIVAALGSRTNRADAVRGAHWSLAAFPVSDNELIVTWTDYRAQVKTGGQAYATRFVRSGAEWTSETILIAESTTPVQHEHYHCGGYLRHEDGRVSVVVSTGDSAEDNQLLARTLAAGGEWASPVVVPDTGIDDRSRVHEASPDWTAVETVWGGKGIYPLLLHNQVVKMVPGDPECRRVLCGADETNSAVLELTYDPDLKLASWRTVSGASVTSWPDDGVLNFGMVGQPGGPYLGRIDAAAVSAWQAGQRESRVLFSPDGEHWGQIMVAGTSEQRMAIFHGTTGYIGSLVVDTAGFRRFEIPPWRLARPLVLGRSQDNMLRAVVPVPTADVSVNAEITRLNGPADLPPGVPPPPCDPGNMFLIENRSDLGHLGAWRPVSDTADVPEPRSSVLIRAWAYAVPPQDLDTDPKTTASLVTLLYNSIGDQAWLWSGRGEFEAGRWFPVTVWATWNPLDSAGKPQVKWLPTVALRAAQQDSLPLHSRYVLAWEGVYQDAPTAEGFGLAPQQPGAEEAATIDGLTLGDEWTVVMVGMVPDDQWDNRVGGSERVGYRTASKHLPHLFTLEDSEGDFVRVLADPPLEGMRFGTADTEVQDIRKIYWLRESPVVCVVRGGGGQTVLNYSVGGSAPRTMTLPEEISPERIRLGPDGMWWFSLDAMAHRVTDGQLLNLFYTHKLRCPADFNSDGIVDSRDVLAFLSAWSGRLPNGDYNQDTMINTLDVIDFLADYGSGC
ncbi:MAG: hypothetical protein IT431_10270 [Phycisphaerales bacterium]|nr:hypothetical protein [Phycisphaerales bacterium]